MPKAFLLKRRSQNSSTFRDLQTSDNKTEDGKKRKSLEKAKEVSPNAAKVLKEAETQIHYHPLSAFTKYQNELHHQQRLIHNHFLEMQLLYPYGYPYKSMTYPLQSVYQNEKKVLPFPFYHRPESLVPPALEKPTLFPKVDDPKVELPQNRENSLDVLEGMQDSDMDHPLKCEQCGKTFKTKYTLAIHLKMPTHTGARPFVCSVCGKGFRLSSTLCRHKIIHTTDRPHKCHICDKAFNRSSTLKTHIRTHSEVKEYLCDVCGKGFHQKGNLRNHALIHTGEKPYKCQLCEKAFNKLSNLKFHMHVHTDNSPYRCRYCKVSFSRRCDLKWHIANVHEKDQNAQ